MQAVSLEEFKKAIDKRNTKDHVCKKCGGSVDYSVVEGTYTCKECGFVEWDTYGKIKDLLERNPNLSRIEIAAILHIKLRDLNRCFENGTLINPKMTILG